MGKYLVHVLDGDEFQLIAEVLGDFHQILFVFGRDYYCFDARP
jgi:hypothetical protein